MTQLVKADPDLPVFNGESWEAHVSAWIQIDEGIRDARLIQGAIVSSLTRNHGKDSIGKFASDVKTETRRVYEAGQVYAKLQICGIPQIPANLKWTHLVDALRCKDYKGALILASDNDWSSLEFQQKVRSGEVDRLLIEAAPETDAVVEVDTCTTSDLYGLIGQGHKFKTIYADPPWKYGNQSTRAATDNHYETMSLDEIAALPIKELVDEESHLHLWTTTSFRFDCLEIIKAWGFEYKSEIIWCKPQIGIGNYVRVSHETLLVCTRGGLTGQATNVKSWLVHDRTKHSEKPEKFRKLIEAISPGPRLELFGRRIADGWTVWGNEIKRTMFDASVPHTLEAVAV